VSDNLQRRFALLLAGDVAVPLDADGVAGAPFSSYDFDDSLAARELADEWIEIAEKQGGHRGLAVVLEHAEHTITSGSAPGALVQYALRLFATHYPPASERLRTAPLERRQPGLAGPSRSGSNSREGGT